jgi:hypothetical protein
VRSTLLSFFSNAGRIIATMFVRRVFQCIWNAMDWLIAAMVAGIYCLATMWLEGVIAYGIALHGCAPDWNLSRNGSLVGDETGSAQEPERRS